MAAPTPVPAHQPQNIHVQQQLHLAQHQPSSFYQLSSNAYQFPAASRLLDSEVKMEVEDESRPTGEDSDDESDTSDLSSKKDAKQLVVREKGSGSVAFMVLLFSLSLLSGKGGEGAAAGAKNADATAFSFNLNNNLVHPASQSAFDLARLQATALQQQQQSQESDNARRAAGSSSTGWTSSLDALDDDFNYFDRQHAHVLPSDDASSSAYAFSSYTGGMGGMMMPDAAMFEYPTLNGFSSSPFSPRVLSLIRFYTASIPVHAYCSRRRLLCSASFDGIDYEREGRVACAEHRFYRCGVPEPVGDLCEVSEQVGSEL